eukprot:9472233-Pyramimonas_sp.AAC.1
MWGKSTHTPQYITAVPESARLAGDKILAALTSPPCSKEDIREVLNAAKEVLAKVSIAAMKEKSMGFRKFLSQSLSSGASWAHRFSRTWQVEEPSLAVERDEGGAEILKPLEMMKVKADRWAKLWGGDVGGPKQPFPFWLRSLRDAARAQQVEQPLPELTLPDLQQSLRYFKYHAGLGADPWNPRQWLMLPEVGQEQLLEFFGE